MANIVTGAGATVGARLAEHPDVDLVSFTGGLASGTQVMRAAADSVKKVALELGGKNPNVVFADACATEDGFDTAVDQALNAAFIHSGQVCSAGSRLIVEESVRERFVAELAHRAERIRIGRGTDDGVECGPLVSAAQRARTEEFVASALKDGAVLRAGGERPQGPGYFYRPTVLDHCDRTMRVVREEVFGPVLTVETFRTEDEAVALANDTEYGLVGGVWTADAGAVAGSRGGCGTARSGSTTSTPICRRRNGAASASPASAGNSARRASPSTARPSTSTRTSPRARCAGSRAEREQRRWRTT